MGEERRESKPGGNLATGDFELSVELPSALATLARGEQPADLRSHSMPARSPRDPPHRPSRAADIARHTVCPARSPSPRPGMEQRRAEGYSDSAAGVEETGSFP